MKIKSLLILCVVLSIFSCKKKDTATKEEPTPTPPAATPTATAFSGIFSSGTNTNSVSGLVYTLTSANAYFSSKTVSTIDQTSSIRMSRVSLNNDSLTFSSVNQQYIATNTINLASESWVVAGANGIPSFTYINTNPHPSFDLVGGVPNTISKSAGVTFNFNNVSNISSNGFMTLTDGSGTTKGTFFTSIKSGNNSIIISPTILSAMITTTNALVNIYVSNSKVANISGKDFQFNHTASILKNISIIQ
jgi:hypothetical protein